MKHSIPSFDMIKWYLWLQDFDRNHANELLPLKFLWIWILCQVFSSHTKIQKLLIAMTFINVIFVNIADIEAYVYAISIFSVYQNFEL